MEIGSGTESLFTVNTSPRTPPLCCHPVAKLAASHPPPDIALFISLHTSFTPPVSLPAFSPSLCFRRPPPPGWLGVHRVRKRCGGGARVSRFEGSAPRKRTALGKHLLSDGPETAPPPMGDADVKALQKNYRFDLSSGLGLYKHEVQF